MSNPSDLNKETSDLNKETSDLNKERNNCNEEDEDKDIVQPISRRERRARHATRGILSHLKRIIHKNKLLFNTTQYALSFGSFFFPGGTTNYDVIVEALTSVTNMVAFINAYTTLRDPDMLDKSSTVLHFCMLLVTHIEVLLEKIAKLYGNANNHSLKYLVIFSIELFKACYRLYILFIENNKKDAVMIIQWGRGSRTDIQFTYTLDDYSKHLDPTLLSGLTTPCVSENASEVGEREPFTMEDWEVDVNAMHFEEPSRRNIETDNFNDVGITLSSGEINLSSSLDDMKNRFISDEDNNKQTSDCTDNDSLLVSEARDTHHALPFFKEDPASSTLNPSSSDSSLSSFFTSFTMRNKLTGTRLRSHSGGFIDPRSHPESTTKYVDPRYRSWHWYSHFSPHEKIPGGTALLRRTQKFIDVGFSSEQFLILGETLYVLRPVVYSLLLYRYSSKKEKKENVSNDSQHDNQGFPFIPRKGSVYFALAVSMVLEVLSILCTSKALEMTEQAVKPPASTSNSNAAGSTTVPKSKHIHPMVEEFKRRKAAFFLNMLRSPIVDKATLPLLLKVVNVLKHLPLIGSLPPKFLDILDYFSSTYFYTSNSS